MTRTKILAFSVAAIASATGLLAAAAPARAGDDVTFGVGFDVRGRIPERRLRPPHLHWPHVRFDSITFQGPLVTPAYPVAGPAYPTYGSPAPYAMPAPAPAAWPTPSPVPTFSPTRPFGPGAFGPAAGRDPIAGDDSDACGCRQFIPAHDVCTQETVCDPAVYEDRVVPVFDVVCVPVMKEICVPDFQDVTVPVFDERCVPIMGRVTDPRTGRSKIVKVGERKVQVQVGERVERVQVGEHKQQVKVGERKERVQVGERVEHVLVKPETTRVVDRRVVVPGRWVTVVAGMNDGTPAARGGRGALGEVITQSEFEREMALVAAGGSEVGNGRHLPRYGSPR